MKMEEEKMIFVLKLGCVWVMQISSTTTHEWVGRIKITRLREQQYKKEYANTLDSIQEKNRRKVVISSKCGRKRKMESELASVQMNLNGCFSMII